MSHWIALLVGIVVLLAFVWYEERQIERWTREYYRQKRLHEREEEQDYG